MNIPKIGQAFVPTNEISKNRVVYATIIPLGIL